MLKNKIKLPDILYNTNTTDIKQWFLFFASWQRRRGGVEGRRVVTLCKIRNLNANRKKRFADVRQIFRPVSEGGRAATKCSPRENILFNGRAGKETDVKYEQSPFKYLNKPTREDEQVRIEPAEIRGD